MRVINCQIVTMGGDRTSFSLPDYALRLDFISAPPALLSSFGLWPHGKGWILVPVLDGRQTQQLFCLTRSFGIASRHHYDPREERLLIERERLLRLNSESDTVHVQEVVAPGSPPERYVVTFRCRGIVGIDKKTLAPRFDNVHQVEIYCDNDFAEAPPKLTWTTEIWHPNIRHYGNKGVCINREQWLAGMFLDEVCYQMFDMVQYRNYHALNVRPHPYDEEAARWVLTYAEPRGIVDKRRRISVDNKPFWKPSTSAPFIPRDPFDGNSSRQRSGNSEMRIKVLPTERIKIL